MTINQRRGDQAAFKIQCLEITKTGRQILFGPGPGNVTILNRKRCLVDQPIGWLEPSIVARLALVRSMVFCRCYVRVF
jgi:hypothetical protein